MLLTGVLVLSTIILAVSRWGYENSRTQSQLERMLEQLDATDPNWRLDEIQQARADLPEDKNSARLIVYACKLLPKNFPDAKFDEQLQDAPLPHLLDEARSKLMEDEMRRVAPALEQARQLVHLSEGRHRLEIGTNPLNVILHDQQETRRIATLLRYDAWNSALKGDMAAALLAARAGINAGRSFDDEPFAISQLVRIACVTVALSGLERSLSLGEPKEADLAEVQKLLKLEEQHRTMQVVARGERAVMYQTVNAILTGVIPSKELFHEATLPWQYRLFGISRSDLRRQQVVLLELMNEMVEAAKLPDHEQVKAQKAIFSKVHAHVQHAVLVQLLLPAMERLNLATLRKTGQVRCMMTSIAVERTRRKTGKWPARLEDIPKEILAAIPLDPTDGKPIRYRQVPDGVLIYFNGDDGVDNGGNIDPQRPTHTGTDMGYRLWDVSRRRQPALPARPKPEEEGPGGLGGPRGPGGPGPNP